MPEKRHNKVKTVSFVDDDKDWPYVIDNTLLNGILSVFIRNNFDSLKWLLDTTLLCTFIVGNL